MATKTISVTDEAYMALLREKKSEQSFIETIIRIPARSGKLATRPLPYDVKTLF